MHAPGNVRVENVPDSTIIEPRRVFDSVTNIDGVPESCRAMDERKAIKVMIKF